MYVNNLAFRRICYWLVLIVCFRTVAEATPSFSFTVTCTPSSTYNWRVIASTHNDMSSAITVSINGSFNSSMTYPLTQGPSSGSLGGYGSQELYFVYQVQFPDANWYQLGAILGPIAADGGFTSTFEFTPPNCLPGNSMNPDIPITIGNGNPWGGYPSGSFPNGDPVPPPSEWPYPPATGPGSSGGGGWPPYIPPGGGTNIIINITNLNLWGLSGPGDINWRIQPGAPPVVTNNTYVTNLTQVVTNVNGTNQTITVTNVSGSTVTVGGLPSGGTGTGSAADGSESLLAEILKIIVDADSKTLGLSNMLAAIHRDMTNGLNGVNAGDEVDSQIGGSSGAAFAASNSLHVAVFSGAPSLSGADVPLITLPDGAGGTMQIGLNSSGVLSYVQNVRPIFLWLILFVVAVTNLKILQENIRHVQTIVPSATAGNEIAGTSLHKSVAALIVAAAIVSLWTAITGVMMGGSYALSLGILSEAPDMTLLGFGAWINSYVPLSETVIGISSIVGFRVFAFQIATFASAVIKHLVGL